MHKFDCDCDMCFPPGYEPETLAERVAWAERMSVRADEEYDAYIDSLYEEDDIRF